MTKYYSEHRQDFWLSQNLFKNKRNGVFVEFGAINGIDHSNSLYFEQKMGWTGLCLEPNPEAYDRLKVNRNCICKNYAVGDREAMVDYTQFSGGLWGWGGVSEYIEEKHQERIDQYIPMEARKTIQVQMKPLLDILKEAKLSHIDYMSIDTEGSEYSILSKFFNDCSPLSNQISIDVFDIENNFGTFPIEKLMTENGYIKVMTLDINEIYVKA